MSKPRNEVAKEDKWNVEALYLDGDVWENHFQTIETARWPKILACLGKLKSSQTVLKECMDEMFSIDRHISKLYTYAHLRHDEDITDDLCNTQYGRITNLAHEFAQDISWFEPELLSLSEEQTALYLSSPELKEYRFYLEKILRAKKHTLSEEGEKLLALAGRALHAPHKAFSALDNADFVFGSVLDAQGKERELTHALYGMYVRDQDRTLRENAFKKLHNKYLKYENTLCELISGQVQAHYFHAKAKNYASCLEAALFPKNIDVSVYHALLSAVNQNVASLHRYSALRKKILGLKDLHLYDMHVPLTPQLDIRIPYQEAEDFVIDSVAPLGSEYQTFLKKGLKESRWVDRYENKNKRSGAYSSGCFDSQPYILMNYKDILRDAFTLAHEAGHSMHSLYSRLHQPYHYSDYPIFLAEVASTFNEELLSQYLLKRAKTTEERIYLINQKIEDIRATLFRQTMFAEFELFIHTSVENNIPLTPKFLKDEFRKLNSKYYGPDVVIDEEIDIEWARIPHFYYNFYVYQYATGISAAHALCERVVNGGNQETQEYLSFLKSGCSKYPIETLASAGVDMRSAESITAAIGKFDNLVDELERLTSPVFTR